MSATPGWYPNPDPNAPPGSWRYAIARRYADAIGCGGPDIADVGNEGDDPHRRIRSFALRNGLDRCVF